MRLLTRPDLDGLTSALLLRLVESIDEVLFVEPHPMQTGQIPVTSNDIIANLPFHPQCGKWFDHHESNRPPAGTFFKGAFHIDPSAARTIYNHYRSPTFEAHLALLEATDRVDSATLTLEDVRHPEGYVLLSLTLDSRSNLEISDHYFHQLLELLGSEPIETILQHPEVASRVQKILTEQHTFQAALLKHSWMVQSTVITDFRGITPQPVGSRFLIYALFPTCTLSIRLYPARQDPNRIGVSVGHSIFNRTQPTSAALLCARHGGGGHFGAASCVVAADNADAVLTDMLTFLAQP